MPKIHVSDNIKLVFDERLKKITDMIKAAITDYEEFGIFGSYARGDFISTSDIDFCIITNNRPNRRVTGCLREDADILGADIIFITPKFFKTDNSIFAENLRRDYIQLEVKNNDK